MLTLLVRFWHWLWTPSPLYRAAPYPADPDDWDVDRLEDEEQQDALVRLAKELTKK
jgi:hypothetical protein